MVVPEAEHMPSTGVAQDRADWRGSHKFAVAAGLGIGVLLCVLNVLVLFRAGTSFGGSALVAVLGAGLLRIAGALNWQGLFVVFSIASSGYVATAALDTGVGAVLLQTGALPSWALLLALAVLSNLLGIALGSMISKSLIITERLPYPTLQPAITLMKSLSTPAADGGSRLGKTLPIAAGIGAVVAAVAATWGQDATPDLLGSGSHVALALSPLLFGVGFLIGPRACLWLAAGSVYSLAIWYVQDHQKGGVASYTEHLAYPWVLACGVGVILGYSVSSLVRVRGPLVRSVARIVSGPATPALRWIRVLCGLGLAGLVIAVIAVPATLKYVGLVALALVLLLVLTVFLNRAGGEIGLVPLAPALYFCVAVFAMTGWGSAVAVLTASTLCCAAIASVYFTYSAKVAHERPDGISEPPRGIVRWTQLGGGVVGAAVGIGVVVVLAQAGVIGGTAFPSPVATAVSFVDSAVRGSTDYPATVALALAIAGPIGVVLTFTSVMPTMLGLGVLLPPAYSLTIAAGGLTQWLIVRRAPQRKSGTEIVASGLIIGEGLVMIAVLVVRELMR